MSTQYERKQHQDTADRYEVSPTVCFLFNYLGVAIVAISALLPSLN